MPAKTDLGTIINAWPALPAPIRAGIVAIVEGSKLIRPPR